MPNRGKTNPSPQLTISGKWLKELGFEVGTSHPLGFFQYFSNLCYRPMPLHANNVTADD
ncbi:SymE family type I addiction module toxin [Providencia stuartii]|nr:SymE family type I addiction module toxin [Providencia stuartii]